jgi:protein involved in polysaccharide export with SLBB domain
MRYDPYIRGSGVGPALVAAAALLLSAGAARAQPSGSAEEVGAVKVPRAEATEEPHGPQPFGANLFMGNFLGQHEDGVNPDYVVMPGDRVAVNTWGVVEITQVFVVDGQGNIFLPGIGPVRLAGVRNADLTRTVKESISRVYRRNFGVYTNLLTAAPVAVFVTGGVNRPGRYAGVPSDSVLFFLDQAGGIDPALGSYRDIVILRGGAPLAEVDLYDFILNGKLPDVQFTDGDTILVRRRGPVVEVKGEVASEGFLEFDKQPITGADALEIVPKAARATAVIIQGIRGGQPFAETKSVAEFRVTELRDGDAILFRDEGRPDTILVRLEGEFKGPSLLSVYRGSRLVDVLNYVEVDPELADLRSVHLRRASVAAAQKKSIDDSLFRLERSALLALSTTEREASIRVKEAELMKNFIESARLIQPLGRVVTSIHGRQLNVLLNHDDTIVIPGKTNVVRVGGEVRMAQAVVYKAGFRARDYIRLAGGYTQRSEKGRVIILHASASVSMGSGNARVRPGDEILVPPRVDRKILQNAADLTQVIYQIAVAAAVVLAL